MTEAGSRSRKRRVFWFSLFAIDAVLLAVLAWGVFVEPRQLKIEAHQIGVQNLPAECRNLQFDFVADIHTGSFGNGLDNLDRVVTQLRNSPSSFVVLGGDYVILSVLGGKYVDAGTIAQHLKPLTAVKPVYAVLGNHDWWKNGDEIRTQFERAGVRVLEDQSVPVRAGSCNFTLVGISDYTEAPHDVHKAFAEVPQDQSLAIALTHNPILFGQVPSRAALVLAGHTHGGQIKLPLLGYPAFWFKSELQSRYIDGLYRKPDGQVMFVTRGIGTSIMPIRLGVPPEISRLRLVER